MRPAIAALALQRADPCCRLVFTKDPGPLGLFVPEKRNRYEPALAQILQLGRGRVAPRIDALDLCGRKQSEGRVEPAVLDWLRRTSHDRSEEHTSELQSL